MEQQALKYKGFTIKKKLIFLSLFPIIILSIILTWSIHIFIEQATEARVEFDHSLLAQTMDKDIVQIQQWLTDISATRAAEGFDDGFSKAKKYFKDFQKKTDIFEDYFRKNKNEKKLELIRKLRAETDNFYQAGIKMAKAYIAGGPAAGNEMMGQFDSASERLQYNLVPFIAEQKEMVSKDLNNFSGQIEDFKTFIITISVFTTFFLMAASFLIFRSILVPLNKMIEVIHELASGKLGQKINISNNDEIGTVAKAINQLSDKIFEIFSETNQTSEQLASTANQLNIAMLENKEAINNINQGIHEENDSIEDINSSLKKAVDSNRETAEKISKIETLANQAKNKAAESKQATIEASNSMVKIEESGEKMEKIISVITDIANQTNLLSLNAAIEAAKAGESGKGFAVVAEEVRTLAERSNISAVDIRELIEVTIENVKSGSLIVQKTDQELNEIISQVNEISEQINLVNHNAKKQLESSNYIANSIEEVSFTSNSNSTTVTEFSANIEQAKKAAEELNQIAENLKGKISFFSY